MLGNLIGGFIIILVGTALLPVVANSVVYAIAGNGTQVTNVTGAAATLVGLTTLFYALAVATAAMGIAADGLKNVGF